ncbi:peptidase [Leptolyngbya sp. 'hensonii']|uniref:S9 family peptidase n=1 Tax=Leptolyngbya sp. 'hensonii' TaxID=1922337 RepID=UPI00094FCE8B|nr:S9 family peptidase [Leptolyngbya sp. 'hensonii']OLP15570.1 peptidase [Leptolyngbya sp. 'hensonii']
MSDPTMTSYGAWKSPITADLIVQGTISLGQVALDGADLYWLEGRPLEGGRNVLVRRTREGKTLEITPAPFNVRSRVHEMGGTSYLVHQGRIYFSNFADQRLYTQTLTTDPVPLTLPAALRYADAILDGPRQRLICVLEDHTIADREPVNTLAAVPLEGTEVAPTILVAGNDFYASPRLSPDGSQLAWLTWNHPNMPWDGTELWLGEVTAAGRVVNPERIAGGKKESIFQPQWSPDGRLYFVSDRSGWYNLYRWQAGQVEALLPMAAEFGEPQWFLGQSTYGFASPTRIICTYSQWGTQHLASLDLTTGTLEPIATPDTAIGGLQVTPTHAIFLGGSPTEFSAIVRLDLATGQRELLRCSSDLVLDPAYLSVPQAIEFPTDNGLTAHGFYYPPQNRDYLAPATERPPLLVKSHGGPTAATSTLLNLRIQYWTSRGFAVLDVNYGGSTGYGRAYRERLKGQWGLVDVNDCVNGALYLVAQGKADGDRLVIAGGSAGGYTTLCALTFREVFKAGASYFGISDLEALARDTHKFESRYLDSLIGPYPERLDLYQARSPIHFAEKLSCPIIFFQGLEDKIVPPNQAEEMVEVLKQKGLPVAYVAYEGEQHGFRKAENIKRTLDGEFYFYGRVFGFDPADPIDPVEIWNLTGA